MDDFRSKRDAWIVILIWAGVLLTLVAGFAQLSHPATPLSKALVLTAALAIAGFMLWVLYGTWYEFSGKTLLIRSGPFWFRVPLNEIDGVEPTRNPLSSPACSLDRLMIRYRDGKRRIMISPHDKVGFLRALANRCAHLERDANGLTRR